MDRLGFKLGLSIGSSIGLSVGFILLASIWIVRTASAQGSVPTPVPVTDDQVNAIARNMYCPVCENTPLDVCPTQACAEWRELIREKLSEGWSEGQIRTYFVERFGDRVLATPPARGLNWLVYGIPPIAFLAGVFLLVQAFRSWRLPPAGGSAPVEERAVLSEDPYLERLEEEIRRF